jgi:hypothetical protein
MTDAVPSAGSAPRVQPIATATATATAAATAGAAGAGTRPATEGAAGSDLPHGVATEDDAGGRVLLVPVPVLPVRDSADLPEVTLAFRRLAGETVAEGYTSLERLVDACGPAQPWVAFSVADSIRLLAGAGASVLVVDAGGGGAVGVDLTTAASDTAGASR